MSEDRRRLTKSREVSEKGVSYRVAASRLIRSYESCRSLGEAHSQTVSGQRRGRPAIAGDRRPCGRKSRFTGLCERACPVRVLWRRAEAGDSRRKTDALRMRELWRQVRV